MFRIVIWHIFLRMDKLSEIEPPLCTSGFWTRFYILVLEMTFFSWGHILCFHILFGILFPFSIWTFISLLFSFSIQTFISLFFLDFYTPSLFFPFLFRLLFPFSIETFISLFYWDFYFPFLFRLLCPFPILTFISLFSLDFYFSYLFGLFSSFLFFCLYYILLIFLFYTNRGHILDFFQKNLFTLMGTKIS